MKDKILKFFKEKRVSKKVLVRIFLLSVVFWLFIGVNLNSNLRKLEGSQVQKNNDRIIKEFTKIQRKIKSVKILKYKNEDAYYVDVGDEINSPTWRSIPRDVSKRIIFEVLDPNEIKYTVDDANLNDWVILFVVNPINLLGTMFFSNLGSIFSLLLTILMITLLYQNLNGKSKFDVIMPEDISGSVDDLIGMDDLKKQVKPLVKKLEDQAKNKAYNVNKTFNIMFSGPPGTGKTKFAGYLAKELGYPLISASGSNLESGLVGGGGRALTSIYKEARKLKKCVVFLDEAQVLFAKRGPGSPLESKHKDDTADTLLSILDGVKTVGDMEIIWIFASNFNDGNMNVDQAMMRRFKMKLDFRLPNKEEREKLFKMFISKIDKSVLGNINYKYLGEISSGLSPAHIETVVDLAAMACSDENKIIETSDLYKAFEKSVIGVTNRETTAHAQKKRELIGIHELGHFVIELDSLMKKNKNDLKAVREDMSVLKISTESVSKIGALGYVLSKPEEISLKTLNDLETEIEVLYGGVAAEDVFFGSRSVTTGSSNDVQKATAILKTMYFDLGMYSGSKINYSIINNEAANNKIVGNIESKSGELFEKTKEIILKHKPLIEYLSPILIEKYVLQSEEIMDLIEEFYSKDEVRNA